LKKLSVLGVTESRQGGRYYITDLSTRRLIEPMHYMVMLQDYDVGAHLEARIAVDLALTRLACERSTPEEIAKVRELAKAGHQFTHDPVGFRLLDVEFHRTINEAARSPMLARLSQSLYELGFEFRRIATETSGVIPKSLADHDLIARALAARDPDMAEKAFRRHLNNVRESTIQARATAQARHTPGSANVKVIPATHIAARKKKKRSG
jgi:GntR family transcriptional repressor for pyruvate dehydrogenase complex